MAKDPQARTEVECRKLHALLRGMRSFDRFTERIQLAMCRAFTYCRYGFQLKYLDDRHMVPRESLNPNRTVRHQKARCCHDDVIKWKHFPCYWSFVQGIHRRPVNSPRKAQWRGALMFSLICAWINDWVNNREAGDLRRHRAHYDILLWYRSITRRAGTVNLPVYLS